MAAPRRWIRVDVTWSSSEWVIALPPGGRLAWIELLAYMKTTGAAGRAKAMSAKVAARRWDIPESEVQAMLDAARADGAIQALDGDWIVTGWSTYQEIDATGAERQRRHRADKSRLSPLRRDDRDAPLPTVPSGVTRHATETVTLTETVTVTEGREVARAPEPRTGPTEPHDQPPAVGAHVEPNPAPATIDLGGFLDDQPEVARLIADLKHDGGAKATAATIAHRFLYPDSDGTLGDPVVKGLSLEERTRLVHVALLEYATQPEAWNRPHFTGFVKRLREQEAYKPPQPNGIVKLHQAPPPEPEPTAEEREQQRATRLSGAELVRQAVQATTAPTGPTVSDPEVIARREQAKAAAQRQLEQAREGAAS